MSLIKILEMLSGKEHDGNSSRKSKIKTKSEIEKMELDRKLWEMAEEYEEEE